MSAAGSEGGFTTSGIDVGSGAVKTVVMRHEGDDVTVLALRTERIRRRDLRVVIREIYDGTLQEAGIDRQDVAYAATTGEGDLVEFRRGHFFGMTTHARGGLYLDAEARAVLDVGALHARAIRMDARSRVLGYRMTSQCASGSGQFLENIARYLYDMLGNALNNKNIQVSRVTVWESDSACATYTAR